MNISILIIASGTVIKGVAKPQAINIIRDIISRYNLIAPKDINFEGQYYRIICKMAEIYCKYWWSFSAAKEALKDEKSILLLWRNDLTDCADFFQKLWTALTDEGYIKY